MWFIFGNNINFIVLVNGENEMSKGSDIKFAIVHNCKQHGAGLQLAIDLNFSIQCTLNWCEPDDEDDVETEADMIMKYWNDYQY